MHRSTLVNQKSENDAAKPIVQRADIPFRWLDPHTAGPRMLSASVLAGPREEADNAVDIRRIRSHRASEKLGRIRLNLNSSLNGGTEQRTGDRHHDPKIATRPPQQRLDWLRKENIDEVTAQRLRDDEDTRSRLALSRMEVGSDLVQKGGAKCHEFNLIAEAKSTADRIRRKNPPPVPVRLLTTDISNLGRVCAPFAPSSVPAADADLDVQPFSLPTFEQNLRKRSIE
jgi:hypothetical protein